MHAFRLAMGAFVGAVFAAVSASAELPTLKAGVRASGTVAWELDTIEHYELDVQNGFNLEVLDLAGGPATQVAFQGGEVDAIVSDWLWVARQRAEGRDYVFIPYSKAVGGLLVPENSDAETLADLAGGKIGIAGGPLDKSWLILRAYAEQEYGLDIAAETEQVFGAPPLIFQTAVSGDVDGAINFWHFMAKMEAAGMRPLISVSQAAEELGLDPDTPLLGYVVRGETVRENPGLVEGFAAASRAAKELLQTRSDAWDRLRERMNPADDTQFEALKAGWIAGIPNDAPVDEAAADRMLKLMAELGGEDLLGSVTELPPDVFFRPGS